MERRRVLLVVAAVVAVLGLVLVLLYVRGADQRAAAQFDTVKVLRAQAVIEPGEAIDQAVDDGKITVAEVTRSDLLPTAQTSTENLVGKVAVTRIFPGEQIIADKFGASAETSSPLQIPDGMVAISVNLTDPARVAGFVNPGSEIVVFMNGTRPDTGQTYTRMLLPRVTVLGVGSTTPTTTTTTNTDGEQTTEQLPRTLLTIAVSQKDAEKVLYATANGEVVFGLLTGDSKVRSNSGTSAVNLFG